MNLKEALPNLQEDHKGDWSISIEQSSGGFFRARIDKVDGKPFQGQVKSFLGSGKTPEEALLDLAKKLTDKNKDVSSFAPQNSKFGPTGTKKLANPL